MENRLLVSVIVPVYNTAPYLAEALDSVLHQTYNDLEIILVDDGSTDGSGEICEQYAKRDRRIVLIHQENKGLSSARNAALDRMTGEAVAFLDSDDAYQPGFVQAMLSAMVREQADLTVCRYAEMHTEGPMRPGERDKRLPSAASGTYDRAAALRALVDGELGITVWNKLYRRALWETVRFPDGHVFEDTDTTFRILDLCGAVYVSGELLYLQRVRGGSISATCSEKNIRDRLLADSHLDAYVQAHTPDVFPPDQLKRLRQSRHSIMINSYFHYSNDAENRRNPFCEELRRGIIASVKENGIHGFRNTAAYELLRFCPWLLRIIYPAYLRFRLLVKKLTGR